MEKTKYTNQSNDNRGMNTRKYRASNSNCKTGGFSRLKPTGYTFEHSAPANAKKVKTNKMKEFVVRNKPFDFFVTLTFGRNTDIHECCKYANALLYRLNNKLFGKGNGNKSEWIEGFAFIEEHKQGKSRNDIHIHMLLKHNDRFDAFDFVKEDSIFYWVASQVRDAGKAQVFHNNCIDIKTVRDDGAIEYCFKQIWDKNLDRIKYIGCDGISDSL